MLMFMLTCVTCTCYAAMSRLGEVVNVHVNLRHMRMLRHVLGWVVGCVDVHINLRHMRMLRHVLGWGWGVLTFILACATCICYVTSGLPLAGWHHSCSMRTDVDTDVKQEQDLVTCRH